MLWTSITGIGAIFSGLAVGLGAFAAHGLKNRLDEYSLGVFETAVKYQMYHALALIALGLVASRIDGLGIRIATVGFVLGIVIFSGSLYALALSGVRWLGAITPIGGVAFLVAWIAFAWTCFKWSNQ